MDDPDLHLNLQADELDAALPADVLSVNPVSGSASTDEDRPADPSVMLPEGFMDDADDGRAPASSDSEPVGWEPGLAGRLLAGDGADGAEAALAQAPVLALPEGLFEAIEPEHVASGTLGEADELDSLSPGDSDPVAERSSEAPPLVGAGTPTGDVTIAPTTPEQRDLVITSSSLAPAAVVLSTQRRPRLAPYQRDQRNARMAAAGVAVAVLLGAILVLRPDPNAPQELETALPRPTTVGTALRPFPTSPPPLVAAGAAPIDALPADPLPAADDAAAPGGPAAGRPAAGPAAPAAPGPGATTPRTGAAPAPATTAPRAASPTGSTGSSPAPAPQPPPSAGPAPTRAPDPEPQPQPDPAARDRRSESTVETSPPTTQAPPPTTVEPPPTSPPPTSPPPTRPPPTSPPTTSPPPPTTSPPVSSVPVPTRPCFDGTPPRPVPCD